MAIQSMDQLIAAISAGKTSRYDWNKVTSGGYVAGRSYDLSQLGGLPIANAFPGTALTWQTCTETTGNGTEIFGMPHSGNVSTEIKHLLNMSAWSTAASGVPGTLMLVDMQGYYPGINPNIATEQTLLGTPTLRYANGEGLRAYIMAYGGTLGASAQNIAYNYNNQAAAAKANPVTVATSVSSIVPTIIHSGIAANNYGPFLPMAGGDTGIQKFNTVTFSATGGSASNCALVLVKPLAQITISVIGLMTEKDLLNQIPSLPVIKDGACLTWIWMAGAATATATTFGGSAEVVWG